MAKAKVIREFCGLQIGELMEVEPNGHLVKKGYVKLVKEKKQTKIEPIVKQTKAPEGAKQTKIDPKAE